MKSSPLLNGRTANPSENSKRPIALSIMGSSSTTQTTSAECSSPSVMRICAIAPFSMWDVAIMLHISPDKSAGQWDLSLTCDGGPARHRRAAKMRIKALARVLPRRYQFPRLPQNEHHRRHAQPSLAKVRRASEHLG